MAGEEAGRYWEAVATRDWETARAIARAVVARLRHDADELEERGQWLAPTSMRLEAWEIERGELAPFPKQSEVQNDGKAPPNLRLPHHGRGAS